MRSEIVLIRNFLFFISFYNTFDNLYKIMGYFDGENIFTFLKKIYAVDNLEMYFLFEWCTDFDL